MREEHTSTPDRHSPEPTGASRSRSLPRVDVLGVHVCAINPAIAVAEIDRRVSERDPGYVTLTGVHGVVASQDDRQLRDIHNRAALVCPDGMPMVWAGRFAGVAGCARVYGPDLMLAVCRHGLPKGWRHFLYGGAPGVADELARALTERFPGLRVVGTYCPPFRPLTPDEEVEVASRINATDPDVVWVGLSTPKQERWMAAMRSRLDAPVLAGVGAAFDFNTGRVPRAPAWMQRSGLEWLFRICTEPRRLGPRYLKNNPRFVLRILRRAPRVVEEPR